MTQGDAGDLEVTLAASDFDEVREWGLSGDINEFNSGRCSISALSKFTRAGPRDDHVLERLDEVGTADVPLMSLKPIRPRTLLGVPGQR